MTVYTGLLVLVAFHSVQSTAAILEVLVRIVLSLLWL